jgi:rhamnopyranosyl-N-acetylglucosaminyl-diphospho-decaprenol beta-1,3/1,4-galactofuranosyltransferase
MVRIGVSLTTFNRKDYLKKALKAYSMLSRKPDELIVVNNGSTDGTREFLEIWKSQDEGFKKTVIHSETNTGGSGGFYQGLSYAKKQKLDWVLVSDDDAYPDENILSNMEEYILCNKTEKISAICSAVMYKKEDNTSPHIIRQKKGVLKVRSIRVSSDEYKKAFFSIDTITFVGALISIEAIRKVGLPEKDYFIYHDDSEYALQLLQYGGFICLPKAAIFHDCNNSADIRGTWKAYYELRNRILMYKKHLPARYYIWIIFEQYIKRISILAIVLKKYNSDERKLYKQAICDGINNIKGLDSFYKPGYSCRR